MSAARITRSVRGHLVAIERVDPHLWRVTVDGQLLASFCTESRARAAGTAEARRLELVAGEGRRRH
ncbi:hypothetical protein [Anaeromyxobacter terrae]|uniref:hypothetical protein n=1 Tax=Anaeromyxobacter terrae TaxID=2925406 RepID=UPI001F5ACB11|nr:hypothetical protein [Anaeromyxobacter sp. SG22]